MFKNRKFKKILMKAILPAAGFGTRLYPLTIDKPKALIEVNDKPIIEYILEKIENIVDEVFIVTNNKFFNDFNKWFKKLNYSKPIKLLNDNTNTNDERLGSLGDINFVIEKEKINDDILIINTDNLFTFDIKEMHNEFLKRKESVISLYDVGSLEIAKMMGSADIENKKVVYFKEKPENPKTSLSSIGIYMYTRDICKMFKEYLRNNSPDKTGEFLEWLYLRKNVYTYEFKGKWFDIGTLESLNKAKEEFKL